MSDFKIIPNPYIVGNPIKTKKMFYGRRDDFEYIKRKLESGVKSYIIIFCGERRSGKTSILFQIMNGELGDKFLPILIDMQNMAGLKNDHEFFEKLTNELLKKLPESKTDLNKYDFTALDTSPYKIFDKLLDDLHRIYSDKNILLLIDEYELIETKIREGTLDRNLLTYLAGVLESERKISFIFTGSKKLEDRDFQLWNILFSKSLYRNVSFLSENDTYRLIYEPVKDYLTYKEGITETIYRLTAGQPFYTQVVCQNIVDHLNEHQKNVVDQEDLKEIVEGILENPLPQMIYFWNSLSDDKKLILSLTSEILKDENDWITAENILKVSKKREYEIHLSLKTISTTLEGLYHNQLLKKSNSSYCFQMDLLRLWIKRDHSFWQVMKEIESIATESTDETITQTQYRTTEAAEFQIKNKFIQFIRKPAVFSTIIILIALLTAWFYFRPFSMQDKTISKVDAEKVSKGDETTETQKEIPSEQTIKVDQARELMENAEKQALENNAKNYAQNIFQSAVKKKEAGITALKNNNPAEAINAFVESKDLFEQAISKTIENKADVEKTSKSAAELAKKNMLLLKNKAQESGSDDSELYRKASSLSQEAENQYEKGDYQQAEQTFEEAEKLFQESIEDKQKIVYAEVNKSREEMIQAKNNAQASGAADYADSIYQQAIQKENEAQQKFEQKNYIRSKSDFTKAKQLYESAAEEAVEEKEKLTGELNTLQNALRDIKQNTPKEFRNSSIFQQALQAEEAANAQFREGKLASAQKNYEKAIQILKTGITKRENRINQIQTVTQRYEQALETKNLNMLKSLYLDFTPDMQKKWSQVFESVEKVKAEMNLLDYSLSDQNIVAKLKVRLRYIGFVESDKEFRWEVSFSETNNQLFISKITEKQ